ncbi:hypothetical protein, partial [Glutamicibacter sp. V16R2B1]|uniref:hypothetical protein n=1 Tax=Glutamicibacter sp. V16R2B1 TaxID=2036207 RepID=UPI0010FF1939
MSVIAYRTWTVAPVAGILMPANAPTYHGQAGWIKTRLPLWTRGWLTSTATANCHAKDGGNHRAPDPGCVCGIYAWKRPIDPGWTSQWNKTQPDHVAVGVVQLWGRMCDGPNMTGYRAQHARIVALTPDPAGNFDRTAYPDAQVYPDLLTMYSEWDTTPELGFAMNADHAATHAENARRPTRKDHCLGCGEKIGDRQKTVDYD